eukprot:scaffold344_cov132-Chaetoceros_neogracile.AAC.1
MEGTPTSLPRQLQTWHRVSVDIQIGRGSSDLMARIFIGMQVIEGDEINSALIDWYCNFRKQIALLSKKKLH